MNDLTDLIGYISFLFGAFVIGMSTVVLVYYATSQHRYLWHIALMALSYIKMSVLMALTINFRVFYSGPSRYWGAIVALTAFIEGTLGLLLIFHRRVRNVIPNSKG